MKNIEKIKFLLVLQSITVHEKNVQYYVLRKRTQHKVSCTGPREKCAPVLNAFLNTEEETCYRDGDKQVFLYHSLVITLNYMYLSIVNGYCWD